MRAASNTHDTTSSQHPGEVEIRREGAVAQIWFSRPPDNHFNASLIRRLADTFALTDEDPTVRATVLASRGRHFCVGADLARDKQMKDPRELYAQAVRLFEVRKPIVAALQGGAIGGGLGLALVADFRVVTSRSRLAANFVKLGIHPGFGLTYTLPRLVGYQAASELLYLGRRISGDEAVRCGLADKLVCENDLFESALTLAADIAENSPFAVESTRAMMRAGLAAAVRRQTELEVAEQLRLMATDDFVEGVRAVAERRPGHWKRR